jgi:hypothetical protein
MMNDDIKRAFTVANPFNFKHISHLKSAAHFDDVGPCVVMATPSMLQARAEADLTGWLSHHDVLHSVSCHQHHALGLSSSNTRFLHLCFAILNLFSSFSLTTLATCRAAFRESCLRHGARTRATA